MPAPFDDRLRRLCLSMTQAWEKNPDLREQIEAAVEETLIQPAARVAIGLLRLGPGVYPPAEKRAD